MDDEIEEGEERFRRLVKWLLQFDDPEAVVNSKGLKVEGPSIWPAHVSLKAWEIVSDLEGGELLGADDLTLDTLELESRRQWARLGRWERQMETWVKVGLGFGVAAICFYAVWGNDEPERLAGIFAATAGVIVVYCFVLVAQAIYMSRKVRPQAKRIAAAQAGLRKLPRHPNSPDRRR